MDKELPDNIIPISILRINRGKDRKNNCKHGQYEVDSTNKEVICTKCGEVVHPYDALLDMARNRERLVEEMQNLLEQRKRILNWKPHLLAVRELERVYRGGEMLPCCPHCGRGIEARELAIRQVNKKIEMERRKFESKGS